MLKNKDYWYKAKVKDKDEWVEGDLIHCTTGSLYIVRDFNVGGFIDYLIEPKTIKRIRMKKKD